MSCGGALLLTVASAVLASTAVGSHRGPAAAAAATGPGSSAAVFTHFSGEGYKCTRIPSLVTASDGTVVAIAEGRHWTGDGCNPNSSAFNQSDSRTDLVFKRSTE